MPAYSAREPNRDTCFCSFWIAPYVVNGFKSYFLVKCDSLQPSALKISSPPLPLAYYVLLTFGTFYPRPICYHRPPFSYYLRITKYLSNGSWPCLKAHAWGLGQGRGVGGGCVIEQDVPLSKYFLFTTCYLPTTYNQVPTADLLFITYHLLE